MTGLNLGAVVGAEAETVISAMDVNGQAADLDDYGLTAFKLNVAVPFWLNVFNIEEIMYFLQI